MAPHSVANRGIRVWACLRLFLMPVRWGVESFSRLKRMRGRQGRTNHLDCQRDLAEGVRHADKNLAKLGGRVKEGGT